MKEIVKVSLSGISFTMDKEAYDLMVEYFEKLDVCYKGDPDGNEIRDDIEARITELLLSDKSAETIVSADLARSIINQMGMPESSVDEKKSGGSEEFPRRLYRNPEGKKLGGVCSGLGTYLDIDPTWIRLGIFAPIVLLIITAPLGAGFLSSMLGTGFGAIFMLYFVMWIAVPLARSPRQKLEMRGKKITASTIRQNFQEEAEQTPQSQKSASILAELITVFGRIVLFFIKAIGIFVGFILAIVAIAVIVAIVGVVFGIGTVSLGSLDMMTPLDGISMPAYVISWLLIVVLPLIVLGYSIFSGIFRRKVGKTFVSIMIGIWIIIAAFTTVITIKNFDQIIDNIEQLDDYDFKKGNKRDGRKGRRTIEIRNYTPQTTAPVADSLWVETIKDSTTVK